MKQKLLLWWYRKWYITCEITMEGDWYKPMDIIVTTGTTANNGATYLCIDTKTYVPLPGRSRLWNYITQCWTNHWEFILIFIAMILTQLIWAICTSNQ